mmetsp:Transcript_33752/g.32811  ORF Transcript_33752/g.32811 Transcript_33752/m.32811 type:complete len:125 (+) Transcript_33752:268-642(+)
MNGYGTLKWPDGRLYQGSFNEDKRHGEGMFKWKDGRVYRGQWHMGKQHGIGYFKGVDSIKEQKGEWNHGIRLRWVSSGTINEILGMEESSESKALGSKLRNGGTESNKDTLKDEILRSGPSLGV